MLCIDTYNSIKINGGGEERGAHKPHQLIIHHHHHHHGILRWDSNNHHHHQQQQHIFIPFSTFNLYLLWYHAIFLLWPKIFFFWFHGLVGFPWLHQQQQQHFFIIGLGFHRRHNNNNPSHSSVTPEF